MKNFMKELLLKFRFPPKNKYSEFKNLEIRQTGHWSATYRYRVVAWSLPILFLISWSLIYYTLSQTIGSIRSNSTLLTQGIEDGVVRAVQAVGEDGSLVLQDGSTYPTGSYETKAVIQAYFGWPYYSPEQKVLLIPYDWKSVFIGGIQLWSWVLGTTLVLLIDKLVVKRTNVIHGREDMKYYEAIYSYYPRTLRFIRIAVGVIMIFCIGFLLWPLI